MAHKREVPESPVVSLDPSKLLGLRQVAELSEQRAGTPQASTGADASADARTEMSRLLSKIGAELPL